MSWVPPSRWHSNNVGQFRSPTSPVRAPKEPFRVRHRRTGVSNTLSPMSRLRVVLPLLASTGLLSCGGTTGGPVEADEPAPAAAVPAELSCAGGEQVSMAPPLRQDAPGSGPATPDELVRGLLTSDLAVRMGWGRDYVLDLDAVTGTTAWVLNAGGEAVAALRLTALDGVYVLDGYEACA